VRNDQKALADIYSRIITESNGRKIVDGDVNLNYLCLRKLPEWLADVTIDGDLYLTNNHLLTLENCPQHITGSFLCTGNYLRNLIGGPVSVGTEVRYGVYSCANNKLTSLTGAPKNMDYCDFDCSQNHLTDLMHLPSTIGGKLICSFNRLKTLKGCPQTVGNDFDCMANLLTSLEHGPANVLRPDGTYKGFYNCSYNDITNLVGAPEKIGSLNCKGNEIVSLEGIPKVIYGYFDLNKNPGKFDRNEIVKMSKVGRGMIYYDYESEKRK
jgi:hypothetical protein